jgi:hypothetical protein
MTPTPIEADPKGTAEQAIEWVAIKFLADQITATMVKDFILDWRVDDLGYWPDYLAWVTTQETTHDPR